MVAICPSGPAGHRFALVVYFSFPFGSRIHLSRRLSPLSTTPGPVAPLCSSTLFPVFSYVQYLPVAAIIFWLSLMSTLLFVIFFFFLYFVTTFSFLLSYYVVSYSSLPMCSCSALLPESIIVSLFSIFFSYFIPLTLYFVVVLLLCRGRRRSFVKSFLCAPRQSSFLLVKVGACLSPLAGVRDLANCRTSCTVGSFALSVSACILLAMHSLVPALVFLFLKDGRLSPRSV